MKVAKAITSTALCAVGWYHVIRACMAEANDDYDKAGKNCLYAYFFFVPAGILGCIGWNWKNALK